MSRTVRVPHPGTVYDYAVLSSAGALLSSGESSDWVDLSGFADGDYRVSFTAGGTTSIVGVIIDDGFPSGFAQIRAEAGGQTLLDWDGLAGDAAAYVTILDAAGRTVFSGWHYASSLQQSLPAGTYSFTIARSGSSGAGGSFSLDGAGNVDTRVRPADAIDVPSAGTVYDFAVLSSAGALLSSGKSSDWVGLSNLADGDYRVSFTAGGTTSIVGVIIDDRFPSGFAQIRAEAGGQTLLDWDGLAGDAAAYVTILDAAGSTVFSGWHYASSLQQNLPAGTYSFTIARSGSSGAGGSFSLDGAGNVDTRVRPTDAIDVPSTGTWHDFQVLSALGPEIFSGKSSDWIDLSGLTEGKYRLSFNNGGEVQSVALWAEQSLPSGFATVANSSGQTLIDWAHLGGNVATYLTVTDAAGGQVFAGWHYASSIQLDLAPGQYAFSLTLPGSAPNLVASFVVASIPAPAGWSAFRLMDPAGLTIMTGDGSGALNISGLPVGRYALVNEQDQSRREIVVSEDIPGGAATIVQGSDDKVLIDWADPGSNSYYHVRISSVTGNVVDQYYIYSSELSLALPMGGYDVTISSPDGKFLSLALQIEMDGTLSAVDRVGLAFDTDWYLDQAEFADKFGPITHNSGALTLSFDASPGEHTAIQIKDLSSGSISTWFADGDSFEPALGPGAYLWRAIRLPSQDISDSQLVARLSEIAGGWSRFDQLGRTLAADYVLGVEPDKVTTISDMSLSYPSDAVRLADGSYVVTNQYASNIIQVFPDQSIQRVAGGLEEGYGESGPGPETLLRGPGQMLDLGDGILLFADSRNLVIRQLDLNSGIVTTLFGTPGELHTEIRDGHPVSIGDVYDIGRDAEGRLYFTGAPAAFAGGQLYSGATEIFRQSADGSWYFWSPDTSFLNENGFKFMDLLWHDGKVSALVHSDGRKYYVQYDLNGALLGYRDIGIGFGGGLVQNPVNGQIIVGNHADILQIDHQSFAISSLRFPEQLANVSQLSIRDNLLIITDSDRGLVYEYNLGTSTNKIVAGNTSSTSHVYTDLHVHDGKLLALDNQTPRILELEENRIEVLAGTGVNASASPGTPALENRFSFPSALTTDAQGNLYVVESNHRIMKIDPSGQVTVFAGDLASGYSGDGGLAVDARFKSVYGIQAGPDGSIYVADSYNHVIRRIDPAGNIETIAGNGQAGIGYGSAEEGLLNTPLRILVTSDHRLLVSDSWNNRVVEITADGEIVPIAGIGNFGDYQSRGTFTGDGGPATLAGLNTPGGLAMYEPDNTLFIADTFNNRIRFVDSAGNIHTLIGSERGFDFAEKLNSPMDVVLIGDDLYIADTGNALVLLLRNVDRTGNDFENALDIDKAFENLGAFNRSEHASADDHDFYDLSGVLSQSVQITAHGDELRLQAFDEQHQELREVFLEQGESIVLEAGAFQYLSLHASTEVGYQVDLFA